jgi:hypothetical protein
MTLYQEDILEEEVIKNWGTHVSKKYVPKEQSKKVRKSADAFLKVSRRSFMGLDKADQRSGLKRPTMRVMKSKGLASRQSKMYSMYSDASVSCYMAATAQTSRPYHTKTLISIIKEHVCFPSLHTEPATVSIRQQTRHRRRVLTVCSPAWDGAHTSEDHTGLLGHPLHHP